MNNNVAEAAQLYAMHSLSLTQLAEVIEKEYPESRHSEIMEMSLAYSKYYYNCQHAASIVGTEVLIDLPYDTFKAFVEKSDGEWIYVDRDGTKEKYHVSCVEYIVDMCDE